MRIAEIEAFVVGRLAQGLGQKDAADLVKYVAEGQSELGKRKAAQLQKVVDKFGGAFTPKGAQEFQKLTQIRVQNAAGDLKTAVKSALQLRVDNDRSARSSGGYRATPARSSGRYRAAPARSSSGYRSSPALPTVNRVVSRPRTSGGYRAKKSSASRG